MALKCRMAWREKEGKPGDLPGDIWEPKYKGNRPKFGRRLPRCRGAEASYLNKKTRLLGLVMVVAWNHDH